MKKALPVLIVVLLVVALWFAMSSRPESEQTANENTEAPATSVDPALNSVHEAALSGNVKPLNGPISGSNTTAGEDSDLEEGMIDERPATEIYKSADEALRAIKEGSVDYDDLVLDQFTDLGENCSWCDSFYSSVKELLVAEDSKPDQKSYYAEVLAISGRVSNMQTLVEAIKSAKNSDDADIYAEALELAVGDNEIVKYLGEQLRQDNELLREASIAAITNQGSRLAVETLYNHTVQKADPDGFYSMGIGLGEIVPEQEALPYLQEIALKRDQYSHLAVKALLNSGIEGAKMVVDMLNNSPNATQDKEIIKGALDHVSYDEDVIDFFKNTASTGNNLPGTEFAKQVMAEFEQSQDEEEFDFDEEDEEVEPVKPQ